MYESCTHIHIRRFPLHSFSLPPVYIPQLRAKEQNEYRDRDLKEHEDDVIRVLVRFDHTYCSRTINESLHTET